MISSWISSVEANPGFLQEVLEAIAKFPDKNRDVNLICDAMSIKKMLQWDRKREKVWGYCDFGQIEVEEKDVEATEAMVFMLACLNGSWKLPIGYFFQDKCSAELQGELIKTALCLCEDAHLRTHAFTCDGTSTNWASLKALGFDNRFDPDNIQCELKFEYNNVVKTLHFTPDACHALKLARNALGNFVTYSFPSSLSLYYFILSTLWVPFLFFSLSLIFLIRVFILLPYDVILRSIPATYKKFRIGDEEICWEFVQNLHELQEKLHFKLANKLSSTHIRFRNSIMKVKYAAQVLSSSVADAIEFLCSLGLPDFQGSKATVTFLRMVDRVFDFLNSRNPYGKGYKAPIRIKQLKYLKEESAKWIHYFLELTTITGEPLYKSRRKTFIISFTTCIKSVLIIAENLFCTEYYTYLLTYKLSQDLLELFFGIIRLRFGCNNNPTAYQFYFAMKTILLKNDITPSAAGNCLLFAAREEDSNTYGSFLSAKLKKNTDTAVANDDESEEELLNSLLEMEEIDPKGVLREFILYYISGFIVRKLIKNVIQCSTCKKALLKSHNDHNYYDCGSLYERFVQFKNRGGLIHASRDVFTIVKECKNHIILYFNNLKSLKYSHTILKIQKTLIECNSVFKDLECDHAPLENHALLLIEQICVLYLKIRIYSLVNWANSKKISRRKALCKTVLFNND